MTYLRKINTIAAAIRTIPTLIPTIVPVEILLDFPSLPVSSSVKLSAMLFEIQISTCKLDNY